MDRKTILKATAKDKHMMIQLSFVSLVKLNTDYYIQFWVLQLRRIWCTLKNSKMNKKITGKTHEERQCTWTVLKARI